MSSPKLLATTFRGICSTSAPLPVVVEGTKTGKVGASPSDKLTPPTLEEETKLFIRDIPVLWEMVGEDSWEVVCDIILDSRVRPALLV